MSDGFYLADEKHGKVDGGVADLQDVLYFRFEKAGFDNRASKEHVKNFPVEYANFKRANPKFKLPWGEDVDLVGTKGPEIGEVFSTPVTARPQKVTKGQDGALHIPGTPVTKRIEGDLRDVGPESSGQVEKLTKHNERPLA